MNLQVVKGKMMKLLTHLRPSNPLKELKWFDIAVITLLMFGQFIYREYASARGRPHQQRPAQALVQRVEAPQVLGETQRLRPPGHQGGVDAARLAEEGGALQKGAGMSQYGRGVPLEGRQRPRLPP